MQRFAGAALLVVALVSAGAPAAAAPESSPSAGERVWVTSSDQLRKPHRLTWFAEGRWWAVLRKTTSPSSGWRVWRRDADGTWTPGAEVLSPGGTDRFDVFANPDDGRVYAHRLGSSDSELLRLEHDAAADMFTTADSTPVPTAYAGGASSVTVDSAGRVWIVTHPEGQLVYTVRDADTLGELAAPAAVPGVSVQAQSVVVGRFTDDAGPAVGIIHEGTDAAFTGGFSVHRDADPIGTFTTETFATEVDNHSTYAAAGTDLVAVWKDRRDREGEPIILAARRHPDGTWSAPVAVFTATSNSSSANHTRPRVVVDADNRRVRVAAAEATSTAERIHERTAPVDTLAFDPPEVVFQHGGHTFSDVHAGQQPVTAASGALWLARGSDTTVSLWGNHLPVDPPETPPRETPPDTGSDTGSPDSGARGDGADAEAACGPDIPPSGFTDVPAESVHAWAVDCVAFYGVAHGRSAGVYDPSDVVTRGQMASFLARAIEAAGMPLRADRRHFSDTDGNVHAERIDQLASAGVVHGVGGGRYAPDEPVSRAQMAAFLVRAHELVTGAELPDDGHPFTDVADNPHETSIAQAAAAGLTAGRTPTTYEPGAAVRRDQMASFLARTLDSLAGHGHPASPPA